MGLERGGDDLGRLVLVGTRILDRQHGDLRILLLQHLDEPVGALLVADDARVQGDDEDRALAADRLRHRFRRKTAGGEIVRAHVLDVDGLVEVAVDGDHRDLLVLHQIVDDGDQRIGIIRRQHHAVRAPLDRRLENRHLQIDVPLRRALPVELDAELLGGVAGAALHRRVEGDADHAGDEFDLFAGGEDRSRSEDRGESQGKRQVFQSFVHCDAPCFVSRSLKTVGLRALAARSYELNRSRLR